MTYNHQIITEQGLIEEYSKNISIYNSWGMYLCDTILGIVSEKGIDVNQFFKIPPKPRVKDIDSFIEKALFRNKHYSNPIKDITDKVGLRFVVLELSDIEVVEECIRSCDVLEYSKDRDFEQEIIEKPELFVYKSVHYVVKNKSEINYNGIIINAGTTCEIQIRTLLQHGYAELSHDVVYKKAEDIPAEIKRKIARSMALIEASDELFKDVKEMLDKRDEIFFDYINSAQKLLSFNRYNKMVNKTVFEAYRDIIDKEVIEKVIAYANDKKYLIEKLKSMEEGSLLYAQPIMLLIYYLIDNKSRTFKERWPFSEEPLTNFLY